MNFGFNFSRNEKFILSLIGIIIGGFVMKRFELMGVFIIGLCSFSAGYQTANQKILNIRI